MIPEGLLVHQLFERVARERPEHPFLINAPGGENSVVSYETIDSAANRVARLLLREGFIRGDRVGLLMSNSPEWVEAYYGILKAGGVAVPLTDTVTHKGLDMMLGDCGGRFLLTSPRFANITGDLAGHASMVRILKVTDASAESDAPPDLLDPLVDADLCAIIYTSGSTGVPRGAMLTHRNIVSNTRSILSYLHLKPEDRVLAILPFHYVYGMSVLNTHATVGGTLVLENRFAYPNVALDSLEKYGCTGLSGVPSTFAILLHRSDFSRRRLETLRYVTQAGGAMSPTLTRELIDALPGKLIYVMYGATEASARLTWLPPEDLERKIGSIGKPIPDVELRLDENGEILARGANIMTGYWGDPEETARVLQDGWYRTGDLARCDSDGFYFIEGRIKDMIKVGGQRISAKMIEDAILTDTAVHETAVIGIPDEVTGEALRAYVVFRDPAQSDTTTLMRLLSQQLPRNLIPALIEVKSCLPKNEAGKIMKQVLRQEAGIGRLTPTARRDENANQL